MKKRADGRYCKQILLGYQSDGKRKLKTIYGKTIKEIEKKERELRNQIDLGLNIDSENITLSEWTDIWLKTYKADVEYGTYKMYMDSVNNYIKPQLGEVLVCKLKATQIKALINMILEDGHTRTAEICRLTIKQIIEQARIEGIIIKDIMLGIKPVKKETKEKRVLSKGELKAIAKAELTLKQRIFLDLLYYTGLRRGEALALNKDDFCLKEKKLKVNKSLCFKENDAVIKAPKTKAGYREIPIPDILSSKLMFYISGLTSEKMFAMAEKDCYMSRSSFRKFWESIMKQVNKAAEKLNSQEDEEIEIGFTPHIFRHTYATNLCYAGVNIKTAQKYLGHSDSSVTLGIYMHTEDDRMTSEAEKFNSYVMNL